MNILTSKFGFKVNWLFINIKLYAQKICFIHQTWFTFLGHFIPYVSAEFSDAVRGLIFKVNPKLENVHCKLRENLPSSSLNATLILVNACFHPNTSYKKMHTCFLNGVFIPAAIITFFIDSYHMHNRSQSINQSQALNATVPCIVIKTAVLKTIWLAN